MKFRLTIIAALCFMVKFAVAQSKQPNVIVIYVDDMGYGDLSSYGAKYQTPNIDAIGKQGIRFTNFYNAASVCTPSRFAILTGAYPARSIHGLTFALMPNDKNYLDPSETTIASYLKTVGYHTGMIGKWHLGLPDSTYLPTSFGFDTYTGSLGGCFDYFNHNYAGLGKDWYVNGSKKEEKGYSTDLMTQHAKQFIDKNKNSPFFLYLAYNAPHYGKSDPHEAVEFTLPLEKTKYGGIDMLNTLQVPAKYLKQFTYIKDPAKRAYAAMVKCLDDNIGILTKYLKDKKLLDNTMIWFISDNGAYPTTSKSFNYASNGELRGGKGTLWEGGIRVPGMVMWRDKIKPGQTINTPICNVDLVPTFSALTGYSISSRADKIDGKNISGVLFKNENISRDLFWIFGKQTVVRRGPWKLINGTQLFNLNEDIGEQHDIAANHPDIVQSLQDALRIEMSKI